MCPLFWSNYCLQPNNSSSKTKKDVFYFIWKAPFVLEIFRFLYFCLPLFFSQSAINCPNMNLITHFVWYLLFFLQKFRKIPLLVIHYLTKFDDVIWSSCWVISKIISASLCKPIHDIINYSISICPFVSGKCGKEVKKLQKIEYLENKKSFLVEIKNTFHSFWRAIFWWKNKNLIKNSRHKL